MFPFAPIRPRLADRRGWLPAAALALFMFIALLALGGDRGYFYRDGGIHGWNTAKNMAIAENLSPERNFLLAFRIWRDEDGDFRHYLYGRFPIGGYALLKLAFLPFGADLAAKLIAARVLMLLMFCGAAALAFLAVSRIVGSRPVALAAVLLAFSGFYAVYFADEVSGETVMDMFGAALVFHGMAVFAQEGRFRQLVVRACAALLLGWHVYALLLPFIVLGFVGEAIALLRSAAAANEKAKAARSAIISLARSRYVALAAVSILFGSALLAVNFANEYAASGGGGTEFARLPLFGSAMKRFGLTDEFDGLEWGDFIRRQLYRAGVASVPYAAARAVGGDFPPGEPRDTPPAPAVWGAAATVAALAGLALFVRGRRRVLMATAVLFPFCWAVPMRFNTFDPFHNYEAVHYVWLALGMFALALLGARRLPGARGGERLALAVGAAAAVVFAASVFYAGQRDHDAAEAERRKAVMSDFSAIREMTRGESVAIFPRHDHKLERLLKYYYTSSYYLAGSYWVESEDGCAPRVADFAVSRYRDESLNLLTPDNRFAFLYESASPLELCRAERRRLEASEPAARAVFDVYLRDGALSHLKAPCEPRADDGFFAYVYPADPNDLPAEHRRNGFHPMWRGGDEIAAFDGACLITLHPPDYPIAAIRTGQAAPDGETAWDVLITPPPSAEALAHYERAYQATVSSGEPAARSGGFDLYLDGDRDTLSYLKAPCGEEDTRGRFFLSIHPADVSDLPAERRELGHESLNFDFAPPAGVVFDGKCMATRQLPDYDIARIETGQWVLGGGELWDAEIVVGD